jgi:ribonucleoside-diphosphate reductase alpha chain
LCQPQLSSCFLSTVNDDLNHIFKVLKDKANLLKYAGGVAIDWSNLRAIGSPIKSIAVETSGIIPFLKLANDVTKAINRSGRRRGASVAYLEITHLEIEEFLDLRKNTGDEGRRTHELNLAI